MFLKQAFGSPLIPEPIQAKIDRANQTIINLPGELRSFFKEHNYRVIRDTKTQPLENAFRFGEPAVDPAPSLHTFSVICGEVIYHLRSSLDQLIWELIIRNGNDPLTFKRPKPEFPIFDDRDKYKAEGAGKIQGISPWAQAQVLDSQPFPNTHNWPLWHVHNLNVIDKHRLLNTVVGWATLKFRHDGVVHTATCEIVGRTILFTPPMDGEMDVDFEPTFHISLAESGIMQNQDIVSTLQLLSDCVWSVICKFEPAFK